jgi:hypothetical protein
MALELGGSNDLKNLWLSLTTLRASGPRRNHLEDELHADSLRREDDANRRTQMHRLELGCMLGEIHSR